MMKVNEIITYEKIDAILQEEDIEGLIESGASFNPDKIPQHSFKSLNTQKHCHSGLDPESMGDED